MSAVAKQLKIKTGVLKRNLKDLEFAEKELAREVARMEKFKAEGKEESDIKQQQNCLDEAQASLPDAKSRIEKAFEDLQTFTAKNSEEEGVKDSEDLATANELLAKAEEVLKA